MDSKHIIALSITIIHGVIALIASLILHALLYWKKHRNRKHIEGLKQNNDILNKILSRHRNVSNKETKEQPTVKKTREELIQEASVKLDKELNELKKRCSTLKSSPGGDFHGSWKKQAVTNGERLIRDYTAYLAKTEEEFEESNANESKMQLVLKTTKGEVVGRISPEELESKKSSSVSKSLPPVFIKGKTIVERLRSGVDEIRKEIEIERNHPNLDFFERRLIFGTQYEAYLVEMRIHMPADNSSESMRRNWQLINDLFKQYQVLYDRLIDLHRVDVTSGKPEPVKGNLLRQGSADSLELNAQPTKKLSDYIPA